MRALITIASLFAVSSAVFAQEENAVPPTPTPAPSLVEESLKTMRELSAQKNELVRSDWYTSVIKSKGSQATATKELLMTVNEILLLQQTILQNERTLNAQMQGATVPQSTVAAAPQMTAGENTSPEEDKPLKEQAESPVKVDQTANSVRLVFAGGGKVRRAQIVDGSGHEQMVDYNTETKVGTMVPGLGTVSNITSSEVVFKSDAGVVTRVTYRGQETVSAPVNPAANTNNPLLQLLRRN